MASEAAKRKFAPEFMNRIDKTVVFGPYAGAVGTNLGDRTYIGASSAYWRRPGDTSCFEQREPQRISATRRDDLKYGARI